MYTCTLIIKMPVLYKIKIQSCCKLNSLFWVQNPALWNEQPLSSLVCPMFWYIYTSCCTCFCYLKQPWFCKLLKSRKGIFYWIFGIFVQAKKKNQNNTKAPTTPDLSESGERNCFPTSSNLTLCFNEKAFLLFRQSLVAVLGLNWIQLWPWLACWESLTSWACVPTDASQPEKWNCSCFSFLPLEILNNHNFGRKAIF